MITPNEINTKLWKKVCPATAETYPEPKNITEAETGIKQETYMENYKEGLINLILKTENLNPMHLGEEGKFHERQQELKETKTIKLQEIAEENTIKTNNNAAKETTKQYNKEKTLLRSEIPQLIALKERSMATEKVTQLIKFGYEIKTTRSDKNPEMWVYKKGIYEEEGETIIKAETREILGKLHTTTFANEVIAKIQADTYINQDEFFNQQNKHPYLIPVKNGILNIKTRDLAPFTPNIYFFNKINAKYNPKAKCPNFIKFIKEIVERPDKDIKILQELFGFSLVKEYKYEKAFMLYGEHGRNGKSKLLNVLTSLIGKENTSDLSLQKIETERFLISGLHNKLVNISGDISNEAINNTGTFKALTGRDTIEADRKFKNTVRFVNYAKMVFASNELPPIRTNSDAFWLRWVIINFPNQFLPEKELKENPNAKLQDAELINKLTTEKELDGILNWSLGGLDRLEENKDFSTSKTSNEIKSEWLRKSNSVSAFIMDHIEEDYDSKIEKKDFKTSYLKYCKKHRIKSVSDKVIKITLEQDVGATTKYEQPWVDGQQTKVSYWEGIKLLPVSEQRQQRQQRHSISPLGNNLIIPIGVKKPSVLSLLSLFDKNNENFQAKPKISEEYVDYDKSQELEADVSSLGASATNSILSLIKEGNKNLSDIISLIGNEELAKKYIEKLKQSGDIYEPKKEHYEVLE